MTEQNNRSRPIQVFLNTREFINPRESRRGGGNHDFFAGDNSGFSRHKSQMRQKIQGVASELRSANHSAAFLIVQMREEALAKSYRPLNALFSSTHSFGLVGGGRIGEMFMQCTPRALDELDKRIDDNAELIPRTADNKTTNVMENRPSNYRSELGGIEDIRLPTPVDRLSFSAREATEWLSRSDTLGGYVIELFRPDTGLEHEAVQVMINGFHSRLAALVGVVALPIFSPRPSAPRKGHLAISVHLISNQEQSFIALPWSEAAPVLEAWQRSSPSLQEQDLSVERHQYFLEQMAAEPLVRRVSLPPAIEMAPADQTQVALEAQLPSPPEPGLPVVGIVDGGVANISALSGWRAGGSDPIDSADRDLEHGTFIAGLIAGGRTLNPHIRPHLEPSGCRYFDIALMPRKGLFSNYYKILTEFFDQLEEEVIRAKADAGVRVFNLSLGVLGMRRGLGYSVYAQALDDIAREHDVIFVVSAGNLFGSDARDPWPDDGDQAVRLLAQGSTGDQHITPPAEHLLGFSVGAVNPPGIPGFNSNLPTTYTRRGPGVGGARKPDLCQYGGVSRRGGHRTGLYSLDPDNALVDNSGTSFAAPLVASTVATIDHILDGSAPRETLMALLMHRAERCEELDHSALRHVAGEFVGFGKAPVAEDCLSDGPYSVTLVFSETLKTRRELDFVFSWPRSLVTNTGKCRGHVDLTLAFTPPIDAQFQAECLRVQLEASLYQIEINPKTGEEIHKRRLTPHDGVPPTGLGHTEKYLLNAGLKWTPIKRYTLTMPNGRGTSSNWRLVLRSSARALEPFPQAGVPFTLVMSISDLKQTAPVYDEVRNELNRRGLSIADITIAHRLRPRG